MALYESLEEVLSVRAVFLAGNASETSLAQLNVGALAQMLAQDSKSRCYCGTISRKKASVNQEDKRTTREFMRRIVCVRKTLDDDCRFF